MGLGIATKYLPAIMAAFILMAVMNTASGMDEDISDLKRLILGNEDAGMNSRDLAFFLITHDYNALPKDGYVELNLDDSIYILIPNGEKSGLCDIILNNQGWIHNDL